tara:strand:- start:1079 stop:1423 length:345 start_codon:yes stop_codon:yes gene_type:complete
MHKNINHWIGEGQISSFDNELRITSNGYEVTNFLLKITTTYKIEKLNIKNPKYKESTIYVPVVAWGDKARAVTSKYTTNDMVRVVGRLKNSPKAIDKPGWEVVLEDISMIQAAT